MRYPSQNNEKLTARVSVACVARTMKLRLNGTVSTSQTYAPEKKERISRGFMVLFFLSSHFVLVFSVTFGHKIPNIQLRNLNFGYRQDTKQADHADQMLFDVNSCFATRTFKRFLFYFFQYFH
jgi:hypothetical protein